MTTRLPLAKFKEQILDAVSPSFCGAKWLKSTVWLGSGLSSSCHHCPPHPIPADQVKQDPTLLHNTPRKLASREQMLRGEKPSECSYCWKIEDLDENRMSDRIFKSIAFPVADLKAIPQQSVRAAFLPRELEVSFSRTCQFACSYCNASFSTRWRNEIAKNGAYGNLSSKDAGLFSGTFDREHLEEENNPYIEAFFQWWPELRQSLQEIRFTGGETLLSPQVWRLLDDLEKNPAPGLRVALNTNLGVADAMIDRLIEKSHALSHLQIYTSCEAVGPTAEYLRDGLHYETWLQNVRRVLSEGKIQCVTVMMTVNAISMFGTEKFLEDLVELKKEFGTERIDWSVNFLRTPDFQAIHVWPLELRQEKAQQFEKWCNTVLPQDPSFLNGYEAEGLKRMISVLKHEQVSEPLRENLKKDFVTFFDEYDRRRGKKLSDVLPSYQEWLR